MIIRRTLLLLTACTLLYLPATAGAAVTVQDPDDIFPDDGSAFLWLEAESASVLGDGDPADAEVGFILVDKENPIRTVDTAVKGDLDVLPDDTNASGGAAIFAQLGGGGNAVWQVQFAIPATYYLYPHYSIFNSDNNTNYGNEDSIYVPPSFNANSRDDWIGFEGVDQNGDPKTGDSNRDGWMPLGKTIVSAGEAESHNSTDEDFWDGIFHWNRMDVAVDMDENNAFVGDFGQAIQYVVTEDDLGTVLDFEISVRESYGAIDGFLFSTSDTLLDEFTQERLDEFFLNPEAETLVGDFDESGVLDLPDVNMLSADIGTGGGDPKFDITGDGAVDGADLSMWVKDLRKTWFGDANLDGEFSTDDLITALQAGKYEVDEAATWDQGDWNADLRFDTNDLITALQDGGFEQGPVQAVSAVPEPSSLILLLSAISFVVLGRRRR